MSEREDLLKRADEEAKAFERYHRSDTDETAEIIRALAAEVRRLEEENAVQRLAPSTTVQPQRGQIRRRH